MKHADASTHHLAVTTGVTLALTALLLVEGEPIQAQSAMELSQRAASATPRFTDGNGLLGANTTLFGINNSSAAPSAGPTTAFSEILRGRGSRTGYVLSHGAIAPETVRVEVGGRTLRAGQDYWLDAPNGSLFFAQTVGTSESVSVYYRYGTGQDATRQPLSVPGLQLRFGAGTNLGLLYGTTPGGGGAGLDVSTYGLNLSSKFGAGRQSSFGSLAYFSNPQRNTNIALPVFALSGVKSDGTPVDKNTAATPQLEADHLLAQNLSLNSERFGVRASFQDVGKDFSGFQSLKLNAGSDKTALDQVTALEGEKGVKRLGLGLNLGSRSDGSGGFAPGGLALDWNRIQDDKGNSIVQQALGFRSSAFHLDYANRSVDESFTRFSGLRETQKGDWERAKGITNSRLALGFAFGSSPKSGTVPATPANGLDFATQSWGDKTSKLAAQSIRLQTGGLALNWLDRKADRDFKRIADLSKDEKTALALDVAHLYDPAAKAEAITDADRTQIGKEAGLERSAFGGGLSFGKFGGLTVSRLSISDLPQPATSDAAKDDKSETKLAPTPSSETQFARQNIRLNAGALSLDWTERETGAKFGRIGDLADVEKNWLALDIRRQFDPNAKLEQVTQKDRDDSAKESGLKRSLLRGSLALGKAGKTGVFSVTQVSITKPIVSAASGETENAQEAANIPAIRRSEIAFANKALQYHILNQAISNDFSSLADREDAERAQFGNEHGLARREESLLWKLNSATSIGFESLRIRPTDDAVTAAMAAAQIATKNGTEAANGKTLSQLQAEAGDGVQRDTFRLESRGLKLALNQGAIGKAFARSSDLALPDDQKSRIETYRGFSTRDLTLKIENAPLLARVPGLSTLSVDITDSNADNVTDKLGRNTFNRNFQLTPLKNAGLSVSYLDQGDLSRSEDKLNGNTHSLLALKQQIGKSTALDLSEEKTAQLAKDVPTQTTETQAIGFTSTKVIRGLHYHRTRTILPDNTYEITTKLDVSAQPVHSFSFNYSHSQYEKGELEKQDDVRTELDDADKQTVAATPTPAASSNPSDAKSADPKATASAPSALQSSDPKTVSVTPDTKSAEAKADEPKKNDKILSVSTESYNVEVQAAKNFAVLAGGTQKNSSDDKNANTVSFGLKGQPLKDITVTAKFDEQHDNGANTRDVADIAISNAKPLALGPVRDIMVTARYASLNDQRKLQNETMTGRATFSVWKNECILDYGGFTKENGDSTVSRLYSFKTDPNPKRWFHGSFLYKQKSLITGDDQIIRRFQADWKLAKTTNFVYTYGTLPEDDNGNVTPLTTLDLAFKHALNDRFTGEFFYRINDNSATKVLTRSLGVGLEGKIGAKTKYSLAYSLDVNGLAERYIRGNQYHLAFDQQISGDKFFTLSANWRTHDAANVNDDVVANLDFRTRF